MTGLPLEGIRVVDITVVWAGPHCTQLLAEWGAEVIRVEPRQRIQPSTRYAEMRVARDEVRRLHAAGQGALYAFAGLDPGERPWNRHAHFNSHARNKKSMTLDIMTPEGLEVLKRLVAVSDVVVENNVPETIDRAGIRYEALREANPGIIMLRMPAYGLEGPYRNYRSFGNHMEAMTGHHYLRMYPDMEPAAAGNSFTADAAGGIHGALAVLMATRYRRMTGKGQQIELPLAENFLPYIGEYILEYTYNGRDPEPRGNDHPTHAPHGVYPCRGEDRWIAIDVADDLSWRRLAGCIEQAWTSDARFTAAQSRWANRAELNERLSAWTRERDLMELFHALQQAGVAAGPVQDEAMAYGCAHLAERGFFEELTHPDAGTHSYPGLNFRMANTPNHLRRHPVTLGEDNDYVYRDVLGLSDDEYRELDRLGHIGTDYTPGALGQGE